MELLRIINPILSSTLFGVMIVGFIAILFRQHKDRLHKLILGITALWIISFTLLFTFRGNGTIPALSILPPGMCAVGMLLMVSTTAYPILALRPHWLRGELLIRFLFLPLFALFNYLIFYLATGSGLEFFTTYTQVMESFGSGVLFFRFFCLIVGYFYIFWGVWMVYSIVPIYSQYLQNNTAETLFEVKWLKGNALFSLGLIVVYTGVAFFPNPITRFLYNLVALCVWVNYAINAYYHKAIPLEERLILDWSPRRGWVVIEDRTEKKEEQYSSDVYEVLSEPGDESLQVLAEEIKKWMTEEKPYLRNDFCAQVLLDRYPQLTRKKLTVIMNVFYNCTFLNYVQRLRIAEAQYLLEHCPELTLRDVAYMIGFSSHPSFTRSFQNITGVNPREYRET